MLSLHDKKTSLRVGELRAFLNDLDRGADLAEEGPQFKCCTVVNAFVLASTLRTNATWRGRKVEAAIVDLLNRQAVYGQLLAE